MSDILIKNMEMPKSCIDCPCYYPEYYECNIVHNCNPISHNDPIPQYCPLISVPDHGRLIDADALENEAQMRLLECNKYDNQFQKPYEVMRAIVLAPTIIPADKESGE